MARKQKNSKEDVLPTYQDLMDLMARSLGGLPKRKGNAKEQAQDLFYEAMESHDPERCFELLEQCLCLDPKNIDALLAMATVSGYEGEERILVLRGIVETAAKRLGKKAFQEMVPHFWGFFETRPYMRARERLASELMAQGFLEAAAVEYQEMLLLNETDNQGVRYELLPTLLALKRLEEARTLLAQYRGDCEWNVVFAWGQVLERFLSGDQKTAAKSLTKARKQNSHMEPYLVGLKKPPATMPGSYSPGSIEEAMCYVRPLLLAWSKHPDALNWLKEHSPKSSSVKVKRAVKRTKKTP